MAAKGIPLRCGWGGRRRVAAQRVKFAMYRATSKRELYEQIYVLCVRCQFRRVRYLPFQKITCGGEIACLRRGDDGATCFFFWAHASI